MIFRFLNLLVTVLAPPDVERNDRAGFPSRLRAKWWQDNRRQLASLPRRCTMQRIMATILGQEDMGDDAQALSAEVRALSGATDPRRLPQPLLSLPLFHAPRNPHHARQQQHTS